MKFTVERHALVKMVKQVSKRMPGQKKANPTLRLFACAARVFVECNNTIGGTEALVFEDGQCTLPRERFLFLLESYKGRKNLTIGADARRFQIERYEMAVRDYSPSAAPPADFQVFPVTDTWLAPEPAVVAPGAGAPANALPPPGSCEAVELLPAEDAAVHPEAARQQFEATLASLREVFAEWLAAKGKQFEQVLTLGWSGQHEDLPSFLKHLEQEANRLWSDAEQTESDITSSAGAAESVAVAEKLQAMKVVWDKLRAEGVPIDQRPLDPDLPWSLQFRFQAETDPSGKDMAWWRANQQKFGALE